jgi:WD40 repeat protein
VPTSAVKPSLAVAPDESAAVLVDADGVVWVTSLGETPKATRFTAGGLTPAAVAFAADSKRVALLEPRSAAVGVLDLAKPDGQRPLTLDGGGAIATAVAFSPDGTRLAVGYADGTAVVWKVK